MDNLAKLSKSQLIDLLLKKDKKQATKVVIVDDTKAKKQPKRNAVKDKQEWVRNPKTNRLIKKDGYTYLKLYPKYKVIDRQNWVKNPLTNRWIKKNSRTYQKVFPMKFVLNKLEKVHQDITETSKSIDEKYKKVSDITKPRTKVIQIQKALKNSTKSFAVDIVDNKDPLHQLTETKKVIKQYLNKELGELKGFKYIETLKVIFEKQLGDEITTKTAYFNSKTKTLINKNEINEVLQTSRQELIKAIGQ